MINSQSLQNFGGSGTIFCDTIMEDTVYYTFFQTHRLCNSRGEVSAEGCSPFGMTLACFVSPSQTMLTCNPTIDLADRMRDGESPEEDGESPEEVEIDL